ncbi:MAG TPA: hypothetical protein VHA52_05880 [Candidatus Babeliaceae bacterium]|nr:hypothetical protein [Candidatus Babeliaceae bacterium]
MGYILNILRNFLPFKNCCSSYQTLPKKEDDAIEQALKWIKLQPIETRKKNLEPAEAQEYGKKTIQY